ncbi:restriction endonuclease subunit S [Flavobacterium psychrotrophum]|uniref:restriction endonuclease subunit S n=1 Tax=Flavobacterium psychrotrophum TaxID=2294119 RepID=UPI000E314C94|nr:restriction endonuclease subunit S [Flavobacterium psychrotrophum]
MRTESEIYLDVIKYLNHLGYGAETIEYKIRTPSDSNVDLLVTSNGDNLIAVEIKQQIDIFDLNSSDIGYQPAIRQLQRVANELKANVFMISNGVNFMWFKTGDSGRPIIIEPIVFREIHNKKLSDTEFLYALMEHVSSFLENFPITGDLSFDLSLAIYSKISSDLNLPFDISYDYLKTNFRTEDFVESKDIIKQILERWEDLDFSESRLEVLAYIEKFHSKNKIDWQVPRWLADFLISFYPEDYPKDEALDLFSKSGILMSSAYLNGWEKVNSSYFNKSNEFWIKSKELLSGGKKDNSEFNPNLLLSEQFDNSDGTLNCVFLAPPFGLKFDSNESSLKDSVELLIHKALDKAKIGGYVIAIVPDGILLSSRNRKFRQFLKQYNSVKGIINLSIDTFKPYTSVSTSILIIQKGVDEDSTFFASLEEIPLRNKRSNLENIKTEWKSFLHQGALSNTKNGFISNELNIENFHFSNYWLKNNPNEFQNLQNGFENVPLKELIYELKRGNPIKQDKLEEIPFITPASVRSMKLLQEGISFTNSKNFSKNITRVFKDDILINIISTQRGSAALVTDEFEGLPVNQHIIVIRPNIRLIRPLYLAIAMNSEYVQKQLQEGSTATVIPALSIQSFESIYIPVPPFFIQDEICDNYNDIANKIFQTEKELSKHSLNLKNILLNLGKEDFDDSVS